MCCHCMTVGEGPLQLSCWSWALPAHTSAYCIPASRLLQTLPCTKSPGMTSNICNYNSHLHSKHRFCFQLCCLRGLLRGYIQRTPEQALSCSLLKLIKPLELKKFSLWKRSCSSLLLFALVDYQKKKKEYKDTESLKITYQGKNSEWICSSSIPRRQTDMICKQHKLVQVLWGAILCLLN